MTSTPSIYRASFAIGDEHTAKRVVDMLTEVFLEGEAAIAAYERTLCGITFSEVAAVSYNGFRRTEDSRILSLLAIRPEDGAVHLEFSGGATIRLEVARILCLATDLGEPWPTQWQPRHDADERA